MTTIKIDPNVRVDGGLTYAGFEDVVGSAQFTAGSSVVVLEPESGLQGFAVVRDVDDSKRLIFLEVAWSTLSPTSGQVMQSANHTLADVYPFASVRFSESDVVTSGELVMQAAR